MDSVYGLTRPRLALDPPEAPLSVLLVEDDDEDADFLEIILGRITNPPFKLARARTLTETIQTLKQRGTDLVLLDLFLPDSKGIETLKEISTVDSRASLIVLTGANDERLAITALNQGAQDYIVKGQLQMEQLSRAMRFAVERKRAAIALLESEERLRNVIENAGDTILSLDEFGTILSINPAGEDTFGYASTEIIDQNISLLIPDLQLPLRKNHPPGGNEKRNPHRSRVLETQGLHKNKDPLQLELTLSKTTSGGRLMNICVVRDVTGRKQAEARLRKAQEDLVQATKMAVLGQMSAGISHELNQPLEALQAYVDNVDHLLRENRFDEVRTNMVAISELTRRAGKIISNIKNLVQHHPQEIQPISPRAALESALSFLKIGNRLEGIDIIRLYQDEPVWIMGERVQLEQVFLNLMSNALDAMKDSEIRRLTLIMTSIDDQVWITIRDSGPGISKSVLARIFDPFFSTKSLNKGLGLGLAISSGIVQELGGRIEASNHREGGAQFTLTFDKVSQENPAQLNHGVQF
ncbi:MAG: PAS domain S-box protein [Nitrospina sp.]|nr:PAS domain S-box protein [Nitrospina sp.]